MSEHDKLVRKAAAWLRQRNCVIVITEMASGNEEADAIGFKNVSILIECKASRSDFFSDKKKNFRREPKMGMGQYRYYMTPVGLFTEDEIPDGWGWIEVKSNRAMLRRKAPIHSAYNHRKERALLMSTIRRIGQSAPKCVSVRHYTYRTKNRASLGVAKYVD